MAEIRRRLSPIENVIGENLKKSVLSFAQTTGYHEVNMDNLLEMKQRYKDQGKRMSLTTFFVKAIACAMAEYPELNARLEGDELIQYDSVNVGIGVDTPKGLMVVVLKDVQDKGIEEISNQLNELVDRTKVNKIKAEDIQGGTVTMSNLSTTDMVCFTSIVNNNESMILGFGRIKKEVIIDNDEQIKIASIGRVMININHTATSGMPAERFLAAIQRAIEFPEKYLV